MKKFILSFSFLLFGIALMAQQQQRGKFNPQEFKSKLESYVTAEAGFNPSEAQAFYPIYFEMKGKQRGLQRQIFMLKKNAPQAGADKDYSIIIQKIKDLGVEMAKLEVTYYKKLCQFTKQCVPKTNSTERCWKTSVGKIGLIEEVLDRNRIN